MAPGFSTKCPPKFENESGYENWKRDVNIWCKLTELGEEKRALALHLSLSGRARAASSEIDVDELEKKTGVKTILDKLDELFLPEKGRRQFNAFNNLYNMRRSDDVSVGNFISEFEHVYFRFQNEGMKLPDPVMAFMLLSSCGLTESDVQLVMSAISDVTFNDMKSVLKRIFTSTISVRSGQVDTASDVAVKIEPVLQVSENSDVLFTNNYFKRGRGRGFSRGRSMPRGRGFVTGANTERVSTGAQRGRKVNPTGQDGETSRCVICDSRMHWARNCPHAYENIGRIDTDDSETVHLSLFMGFTNNSSQNTKLSQLVSDSSGCAVLDTGCSNTVCGTSWLENYLSQLSDFELANIAEELRRQHSLLAMGKLLPLKSVWFYRVG